MKKNKFKKYSDYEKIFVDLHNNIRRGLLDEKVFNTIISDSFDCVDCTNCNSCVKCTDCVNCTDCQLCYDSRESNNCFNSNLLKDCSFCYNSTYLKRCVRCNDCMYCYESENLSNCMNCIFCVGLKDKKDGYWVCNEEVSKEQFEFLISERDF